MKTQQNSEIINRDSSIYRTIDIDKENKVKKDELLPIYDQIKKDADLTKISK